MCRHIFSNGLWNLLRHLETLKNPPFGNAVPPYKTAVLCMSKKSLMEIGQRSSCGPQILGHPAADGKVKGSTAIQRGHVDFEKTGNSQIEFSINVQHKKSRDEFFSVQNVAILAKKLERNMKQCTQRGHK